ncbi:hypothetical protein F5X96DRAFT_406786 [Biscogniauxia mediterranea]|nr:hypothetical protein F5X96DRAFT_406786 [Biscogniauxia mediterranea]
MHLLHYPRPNHHLFFFFLFPFAYLVHSPQSTHTYLHFPYTLVYILTKLPSCLLSDLVFRFSFPRSVLFFILFRILFLLIPPPTLFQVLLSPYLDSTLEYPRSSASNLVANTERVFIQRLP